MLLWIWLLELELLMLLRRWQRRRRHGLLLSQKRTSLLDEQSLSAKLQNKSLVLCQEGGKLLFAEFTSLVF